MLQKNKGGDESTASKPLSADVKLKELAQKANQVSNLKYDNFKTAKQLNLTDEQHGALVKTLEFLESGKTLHFVNEDSRDLLRSKRAFSLFFMPTWIHRSSCGTVACLGGTAQILSGNDNLFRSEPNDTIQYHIRNKNEELYQLFFNWGGGNPTEVQGARALRGFLETGKTDWTKARSE